MINWCIAWYYYQGEYMHVNVSALKTCNFTNLFETIAEQILSAHSGQSLYWPKIPRIQPLQVHNKCICKCSPNFEVDPANSTQCRDIDECTRYPNICQNGKKCFNTPGSYHCECLPGYENDWTSSGACVGVRIYIVDCTVILLKSIYITEFCRKLISLCTCRSENGK